jgi:DNA-binding NtrC family response regulator
VPRRCHGAVLDIARGMSGLTSKIAEAFKEPPGPKTGILRPRAEKFPPPPVLVVDDEPLIRWSVSQSLADLGYSVEEASDAASALKIVVASPEPFVVVVLDLRLPDMNDLSLLGTLRQLMPDAQVILMTAFGSPEIMADARALGAEVLLKPFDLSELGRLIVERQAGLN